MADSRLLENYKFTSQFSISQVGNALKSKKSKTDQEDRLREAYGYLASHAYKALLPQPLQGYLPASAYRGFLPQDDYRGYLPQDDYRGYYPPTSYYPHVSPYSFTPGYPDPSSGYQAQSTGYSPTKTPPTKHHYEPGKIFFLQSMKDL